MVPINGVTCIVALWLNSMSKTTYGKIRNHYKMLKQIVKRNKTKIIWGLIAFFFIGVLSGLTIFSLKRSQAALGDGVAVNGSAEFLNTTGFLDLDNHNSNLKVSFTTYEFSGYGWSEDIGWLAFGSADNPEGPVVFDSATGVLSGKAKALNTGAYLDFGAAPYGSNTVLNSDGTFSGYAWSEDLGWLDVSGITTSAWPTRLELSLPKATVKADEEIQLTITLKDNSGTSVASSSLATVVLSGATVAPSGAMPTATNNTGTAVPFGQPTTMQFNNGVATTKIKLYKAEQATLMATDGTYSTQSAYSVKVSVPVGTVSIQNANTSGYTTTKNLKLNLAMDSVSTSGAQYRLAESQSDLAKASYSVFTPNVNYTLGAGSGYKTIYAQFKDQFGNESATALSQTIRVDDASPSVPTNLEAYDASDTLSQQKVYATALKWTPSTDAESGLKGYVINRNSEALEIADGVTSTVQTTKDTSGKEYAFYIDITAKEAKYTYGVQAVDSAGNKTSVTTASLAITGSEAGDLTSLTKADSLKITFEQNENDASITAIVTWNTDAPATSQVYYGVSEGDYSHSTTLSPEDATYNTGHTKTIEGLESGTTYYFKAVSTDQNGNSAELTQAIETPELEARQNLFEIFWAKIEYFFTTIWQALRNFFLGFAQAQVANPKDITGIHISRLVDSAGKFVGNAIYWNNQANIALLRNGTPIATPSANRWLDLTASEQDNPVYEVAGLTGKIESALPGGVPSITKERVKEIAVTQESANIEISWLTKDVPSTSLVKYGTAPGNYTETVKKESYDEEHIVIINGLLPEATYFYQISSTSTDNRTTTSEEMSYTLPESEKAKSVFVIIYEALVEIFGDFIEWVKS